MNLDAETIVGFLSGSILTLGVKELFNFINKRIGYKRELSKILFEKRLSIGEKAIAYYWTYVDKVHAIKKSLEIIMKGINEIDDPRMDLPIITMILTRSGQALQTLDGDKYFEVNSIHLYFDLNDSNEWSEDDTGEIYKCVAELEFIENEVEYCSESLKKYRNMNFEPDITFFETKLKDSLSKYVKSLEKYVTMLEKNRSAIYSLIQKIKKQVRNI
jgi:hypothetical protein